MDNAYGFSLMIEWPLTTTTTTIITTSQYGLNGAQYRSESIMGVNAMSTSITAQTFITTRILKLIINNRVRPVIVSNTVLNLMINNMEQEMTLLLKYQKIIIKEI